MASSPPHGNGGEDPEGPPEAPPLERQVEDHSQGGQNHHPIGGQGGQDRMGQGVPLVSDGNLLKGAQADRQQGQQQLPLRRAPGHVHQKQAPEQDQNPGGHLRRKSVAAGDRKAEYRGQNSGGIGGGAQDHGQDLSPAGGEQELHRLQPGAVHPGGCEGVPHRLSVQIDGELQAFGPKGQPVRPLPSLRKGEGEAVKFPLLQGGQAAGGVKGLLAPVGRHHGSGLPLQRDQGLPPTGG